MRSPGITVPVGFEGELTNRMVVRAVISEAITSGSGMYPDSAGSG